MPHLHLPADHSDTDLVLAANVATVVGSQDLYVAWTHELGAGAIPEVEAVVRAERPPRAPLATLMAGLFAGLVAAWNGLMGAPAAAAGVAAPAVSAAQRETSS